MRLFRLVASALLILAQLGAATAQEWPTRYITAIVPFGPGNSVDLVGRLLAARMSELLGQQVIVENVGGAGGLTGTTRAARAAPDGYTIVVGGADTMAQNQTLLEKPPYNSMTDLIPIVLAVDLPSVLVGRNSLPPNSLKELIPYMKANQDKMQFGSSGVGGATHLACAQVMHAIGVTLAHVPYRSAAAGIQDLISGNLDLYCPIAAGALPHIEAKAIKFFGVLTDERSPLLPHLPTAAEQGLPGIKGNYWIGLFAPAGTPEPVAAKLSQAALSALETPAVQSRLREVGAAVVAPERRTPAYLKKFIPEEISSWGRIIKENGITVK
ncbi:MAG: tripartite tricarboxylate transporter substrate binding protein [Xanthobacteraceae bacterium]|nr:tripartite tricarboxylate transporter substrate binding protein [Xanthobacteraceae bacterium]